MQQKWKSSFITTSGVNLIHVYLPLLFFFLFCSLPRFSFAVGVSHFVTHFSLCMNKINVECMNCAENSLCHTHNNNNVTCMCALWLAAFFFHPLGKLTQSNNVYISIYMYSINFGQFQLDYYLLMARFIHHWQILIACNGTYNK